MTANKDRFDGMLLSQARLGIISVLVARKQATFTEFKTLLGLTQGNLTIHLQKLEAEDYIAVTKEFIDRKPRTTCRITAKGRRAFLAHLEQLRAIADGDERFDG